MHTPLWLFVSLDSVTQPTDTATKVSTSEITLDQPNTRVIVGAVSVAFVALTLIIISLAFLLVFLLTKKRVQFENIYDVPIDPPAQPQYMNDSRAIDNQNMEVINNEAYSLSVTQQVLTEDNIAYGQATPQISIEDNVAYGQATPQIPTEDNIAYGQATPQIPIEDNVAYGQATPQIPTEDNIAYGQATPQIPIEDNVAYGQATPQIPTEENGQATPQIPIEDSVAYGQVAPQIPTEDNIA